MSDAQRLELLKEVAGTNVYENRRRESMKIMSGTQTKRMNIAEAIEHLEEKLEELEEEKQELAEYEQVGMDGVVVVAVVIVVVIVVVVSAVVWLL